MLLVIPCKNVRFVVDESQVLKSDRHAFYKMLFNWKRLRVKETHEMNGPYLKIIVEDR